MSPLQEIQSEIASLGATDYEVLRRWFTERDWNEWDRELAQDAESGRLDFLAEEAGVAKRDSASTTPRFCAAIRFDPQTPHTNDQRRMRWTRSPGK